MAAMDHMIVKGQNHQRWVGDNAGENGGIHGVKVNRFGMDNLTEASDGLMSLESPSFRHARHKAIWEISLRKQQPQCDTFRPFYSPPRQCDRFSLSYWKQQSAVEFRFRKCNERNALFRQLRCLLRGRSTADGRFFDFTLMDLPCLFRKARADVFKVLLDVVVDVEQHFFELSRRRRSRRRCGRLLYLFRRSRRLFFFDMDGTRMGHLLYPLAAACRT